MDRYRSAGKGAKPCLQFPGSNNESADAAGHIFFNKRNAMANMIEEKIKAGAKIVDVRTEDEFEDGHFPGALNISVSEIQKRMNELGPKDKPIVLYCASGARSAMALRFLKASGFTDVINAGTLEDMPGF
jgi:phage shock protein E